MPRWPIPRRLCCKNSKTVVRRCDSAFRHGIGTMVRRRNCTIVIMRRLGGGFYLPPRASVLWSAAAFPHPSPRGRTRHPSGPTDVSPASMTSSTGPPRRSFGTPRLLPEKSKQQCDSIYRAPRERRSPRAQTSAGDLSAARRRIGLKHQPPAMARPPSSRRAPIIARPAP